MNNKEEEFLESLIKKKVEKCDNEELKAKEEQLRRVNQNYRKMKQRLQEMTRRFKEVGMLRRKLETEVNALRSGVPSESEPEGESDDYEMDF